MPEFEWKDWMEKRVDKLESTLNLHMAAMTEFVVRDNERKKTVEEIARVADEKAKKRDRKMDLLLILAGVILSLLALLGITRHSGDSHSAISGDPTITASN